MFWKSKKSFFLFKTNYFNLFCLTTSKRNWILFFCLNGKLNEYKEDVLNMGSWDDGKRTDIFHKEKKISLCSCICLWLQFSYAVHLFVNQTIKVYSQSLLHHIHKEYCCTFFTIKHNNQSISTQETQTTGTKQLHIFTPPCSSYVNTTFFFHCGVAENVLLYVLCCIDQDQVEMMIHCIIFLWLTTEKNILIGLIWRSYSS